ncbi:MAG: SDR family NAD(P)-dependent oxidoreductase [Novosphingobium sp.]|nr:SDR family NAD(P)-dependent oxidoreductase [Novosphingobium sp.]
MKDIFGLDGHKALVVGGGYGHGRLTAHLLHEAGAQVAVADIDADRASNVANEIGGHAIVGDVTTPEGAKAIVDEAHDKLGGLTRLANVVGLVQMGQFIDNDPAHWKQQMDLNLMQHVYVCQAAGKHMLAVGDGAIAMVASVSGIYGASNQVAYGMAKAGVMSLARSLAAEWGPVGVRVNAIAPDITAVPRLTENFPGSEEEALAMFDTMAKGEGVPLQRFGRAHELARPLLFLLSDMSSYMTGQCLVIDGGTMVRFPHTTGGAKP